MGFVGFRCQTEQTGAEVEAEVALEISPTTLEVLQAPGSLKKFAKNPVTCRDVSDIDWHL